MWPGKGEQGQMINTVENWKGPDKEDLTIYDSFFIHRNAKDRITEKLILLELGTSNKGIRDK